jgi:hypothetical protein
VLVIMSRPITVLGVKIHTLRMYMQWLYFRFQDASAVALNIFYPQMIK